MTTSTSSPTRVVVIGASGMLGSTLVRRLADEPGLHVTGTVRDPGLLPDAYLDRLGDKLVPGIDVLDDGSLREVVSTADVVVNAVGVVKQSDALTDQVATVALNALLPHRLALACTEAGARFVHVSTDCVFSGRTGHYTEDDVPDPVDFYGRSKLLGEVSSPSLTLRTSIVGHEVARHGSLVDWFLTQPQDRVRGFANAIYSGVTTDEFATLLIERVLPNEELTGLFHVASEPISKYDLLQLLAERYSWSGVIHRFEDFRCDRSMRADRFAAATGYQAPTWTEMIDDMHARRPAWAVGPIKSELS